VYHLNEKSQNENNDGSFEDNPPLLLDWMALEKMA